MADVKWIKLATDIFDNRKIRQIETMPEGETIIVIWLKLLCLAGNINDSGFLYMTKEIPYTEQMLAAHFHRPLNIVQLALQTFIDFGMIEVVDNVLYVSSWEKYQNECGLERIREQTRQRVARSRERKKALAQSEAKSLPAAQQCNATSNATSNADVTPCNAIDIEREEELERDNTPHTPHGGNAAFDRFWAAYPKKVGKIAARKAFDKVRVPIESLLSAIERQKCGSQWSRDNGQYIPNPATWLNQGRWDDEIDQGAAQGRPMTANDFVPKDGKYRGRDFFDDD